MRDFFSDTKGMGMKMELLLLLLLLLIFWINMEERLPNFRVSVTGFGFRVPVSIFASRSSVLIQFFFLRVYYMYICKLKYKILLKIICIIEMPINSTTSALRTSKILGAL